MPHVCEPGKAKKLDNWWRKIVHPPKKLFGRFVKNGFVVADFGCGPGVFVPALSGMVGKNGKVFAIDFQQKMLDMVKKKIEESGLKNVELVKCSADSFSIPKKADFVLLAFVVHEVPDQKYFFSNLYKYTKNGAKILMFEPNSHVSKEGFEKSLKMTRGQGFKIIGRPKILLSRGAVLSK